MREKLTMLVVDDAALNRTFLRDMFQSEYEVEEASDGQEAMEILWSKKIDIVILDLFMPGMNGTEVLKRMKEDEALRKIPIIVKTAVDENMEAETLRLGADDFVFSPIDSAVVKKRVENLVRTSILERMMMKKEVEEEKKLSRLRESLMIQILEQFKNPVNYILELAKKGADGAWSAKEAQEAFMQICQTGECLRSLADNMMEISESEREKTRSKEQPFHLNSIVSAISSQMTEKCNKKGIMFSFEITNVHHEELIGDANLLGQVWQTILENAFLHTRAGGFIRTGLLERKIGEQEVELMIVVQDDGEERKFRGVRSVVELLGGTLAFSEANEKGITVTLRLPYKYVKEQRHKDKKFSLMRALVYNENETSCNYHAANLSRLGIHCEVAETGEMAVEMLREAYENGQSYDIFLIDWYMKDGKKTVQEVRKWCDKEALIIVSASGETSEVKEEMQQAGVDYILEKPVLQSSMYRVMTEICKSRS